MSHTDTERERVLSSVHQNWADLLAELESFSEDELNIPNVVGIWSLKDLISHLETWDRIAIGNLDNAERGKTTPTLEVGSSIDSFNEADVEAKRHKTIAQLWTELHATHGELVDRIQTSPAVSHDLLAVDTCDHYADHLKDIRAWQRSRRSENVKSNQR